MTKLITFYLPQFHEIPENNKWWGNGFTEWTNVKKSEKLFKNHAQPRIPLNNTYYDLTDSKVQEWQSEIAQSYGIYAFCYYHYWFNGKQLLEKPILNMLNNKKVTIPFCTSWANEPWTRAWDGKNSEVLMPQEYGNTEDWELHIQYLLKLFKDERYIKKNNKPVMLIYRLSSLKRNTEMLEYWENRLKENGYDGLFLISMLTSFDNSEADNDKVNALVEFEPMYTIRHNLPLIKQGVRMVKKQITNIKSNVFVLDILDYEYVWKRILHKKRNSRNKPTYLGAFVGWDNSPRKGKKALIVKNDNPQLFQKYFGKQLSKSIENKNEYLFINAWNEWAEGTYLEPDQNNKLAYLEAIKKELKEKNLFNKK